MIHWVLHSLSTALALVALALVWRSAPRALERRLTRWLNELDASIGLLETRVAKLQKQYGLILAREKSNSRTDTDDPVQLESTEQLPGENADQWKKRIRKLISQGVIKHAS